MNELTEQQKIELGRFITRIGFIFYLCDDETVIKQTDLVLNKIHELTQDSENIKEILQNPPSQDNQQGKYQINNDKHHICGICYQSYHENILNEDFMICGRCQSQERTKTGVEDNNGKLFYSGDVLRNEKSLTSEVRIFQVHPDSIVWCSVENSDDSGCTPTQDFIDAGWIVHDRVTRYGAHGPICKFDMDVYIGSNYCLHHCSSGGDYDDVQQWVICELYNKGNK